MPEGSIRISFSATQAFDLEAGHFETNGLSAAGDVITVPQHRHEVSLDFSVFELQGTYAFRDGWAARLRVPFAIKDQSASVRTIEPATSAEIAAMERNGRLHHRSEAYEGIHDPTAVLLWGRTGVLGASDVLMVGAGTSLPLGQTEPDPYALGAHGEQHLHIQFGTGTFDPVLEASWVTPWRGFVAGANAQMRTSLYENDHGFRGSTEFQGGVLLARGISDRWTLRTSYTGFRQGRSRWSGTIDPNSGFVAHYSSLGAVVQMGGGRQFDLNLRWPLAQDAFDDDSDAFDQGLQLTAAVKWSRR